MQVIKMVCSLCKQGGHTKRLCKSVTGAVRTEVQSHGFSWEDELLRNVFQLTDEEITNRNYTDKIDLPSNLNRLDKCDVSIKTTRSLTSVCMADCLRVFDAVSGGGGDTPLHLLVVHYKQNDVARTKKITGIVEMNLTNTKDLLFGTLTREQIEELDKVVKAVPQKRKPTAEEYAAMYALRDKLQALSGAIHLDIKCNSTQSRLQCSFNRFADFLQKNPGLVVAKSDTNEFRGGSISSEISSSRRVFKKRSKGSKGSKGSVADPAQSN